jgi:hypothetical protein
MSIQMKRQGIALLIAVGFGGSAYAGSISANKPESGTQTLAHIESVARTASEHAQQYRMIVAQSTVPATAKVQLDGLQTAVNTMGKDVASLQANRSSLPQWQQAALDHIRPLLVDAAARTNSAVALYNNREHLWTPENRGRVQQIAQDTQQIASSLADYKQYQLLREREARLAVSHPEVNGASQPDVTPAVQTEGTVGR